MKTIEIKFLRKGVQSIKLNGMDTGKLKNFCQECTGKVQSKILEVDGQTCDIGKVAAFLEQETPGFIEYLELHSWLPALFPYGEPVQAVNNLTDIQVKKYPVTNPVTGTTTYVNREVFNAIVEARKLHDKCEQAELLRLEIYPKWWREKYKQYLGLKQFVFENDAVAYREQFS